MSFNVLKKMKKNVGEKNWYEFFLKFNVYMDAILLFLLKCKVTFLKFGGHQTDFIPSTWLGKN